MVSLENIKQINVDITKTIQHALYLIAFRSTVNSRGTLSDPGCHQLFFKQAKQPQGHLVM